MYARDGYDVGVSEERYCSNCRAELPKGATSCPACGVFAGDVFDGRFPGKKRSYSALIVILGVVALIAAAALFVRWSQTKQDAAVNQHRGRATGMSAIRQRLVSDQLPNECLALIREGKRDGAL